MFVVPGRLDARTGGSIYNHRMALGLRQRGWNIDIRELAADFPVPSAASARNAAGVLRDIPSGTITVVDGLVFGALPDIVTAERSRLVLIPVVHMPLAHEVGLEEDVKESRRTSERLALTAARMVVVTGRSTVDALSDYGVAVDRIAIVMPGTDRANVAAGSGRPELHLLCVAALTRGKGHDVLLRALAANRQYAWRLTCVGSSARSPEVAELLRTITVTLGLADRVTFAGELDEATLTDCFHHTDVFVLATLSETFGMAVAEALARGIPVVSTRTGEIPFLVAADAGILAEPGDAPGFTAAIARVLADSAFRARLHTGAIAARGRLAAWDDAAGTMEIVLERALERSIEAGSSGNGAG